MKYKLQLKQPQNLNNRRKKYKNKTPNKAAKVKIKSKNKLHKNKMIKMLSLMKPSLFKNI
jgi:hypothetical protein